MRPERHAKEVPEVSFNPRTRVGCDMTIVPYAPRTRCFNPRTRVGCDNAQLNVSVSPVFQSTHPCGVRLRLNKQLEKAWGFNPRTRVGCDNRLVKKTLGTNVSIHAPVWGATTLQAYYQNGSTVSIHAPVWGATKIFRNIGNYACFNPRTRVGCDECIF